MSVETKETSDDIDRLMSLLMQSWELSKNQQSDFVQYLIGMALIEISVNNTNDSRAHDRLCEMVLGIKHEKPTN